MRERLNIATELGWFFKSCVLRTGDTDYKMDAIFCVRMKFIRNGASTGFPAKVIDSSNEYRNFVHSHQEIVWLAGQIFGPQIDNYGMIQYYWDPATERFFLRSTDQAIRLRLSW